MIPKRGKPRSSRPHSGTERCMETGRAPCPGRVLGGGEEQMGNVQPSAGETRVNIRKKMRDKKRQPNMTIKGCGSCCARCGRTTWRAGATYPVIAPKLAEQRPDSAELEASPKLGRVRAQGNPRLNTRCPQLVCMLVRYRIAPLHIVRATSTWANRAQHWARFGRAGPTS